MEAVLLRKPEVLKLVGFGNTTLWKMTREGSFPQPVRVGPRLVAWRRADIEVWLDGLAVGQPS